MRRYIAFDRLAMDLRYGWSTITRIGYPLSRASGVPVPPGVLATPLCRDVNTVMRPKCTTEVRIAACRRGRQCHKYVRLLVTDDEKQKSLSVPQPRSLTEQMQFFVTFILAVLLPQFGYIGYDKK